MSGLIELSLSSEIVTSLGTSGGVEHKCTADFVLAIGEFELSALRRYDPDAAKLLLSSGIKEEKIGIQEFELAGEKSDELAQNLGFKIVSDDEFIYKHALASNNNRTLLNHQLSPNLNRDQIASQVFGHAVKTY